MIVPSDPDYEETRLIKLGKRRMSPVFQELATWIMSQWPSVSVLNLYYDIDNPTAQMILRRLGVIFEREEDSKQFYSPDGNFDKDKQAAIVTQFREILEHRPGERFDTRGLLVTFSAFEPVARTAVMWNITDSELERLQVEFATQAVWTIRMGWDGITVFFHTDAEMKMLADTRFRRVCTAAFAEMVAPHDEFDYFRKRPGTIEFDSKENFDTTYRGSWFYYDRR